MAVIKYIAPVVAMAAGALGQCSTSATLTITDSSGASALAGCTTYSGSVAIPTGLAADQDSSGHQSLSIGTTEKITNNLTVFGVGNLGSLAFPQLKSVGGLSLGNLTILSTLSMPNLGTVNALNLTALPGLQSLSFGGTGVTQASSVLISNTGLSSLSGLSNLQSVNTFNINNNPALQNISLSVTSIKGSLDIEANDGYISGLTTSFPLLQTAMNLTFRNCSSVSLPSLANVSQDLGFYGNTMQSFAAPNLTSVGGLIFVDNTQLSNISIPSLTSVNATFQIANNTQLKKVDGFQQLSTVKGAIDFNGNFTDVELPGLTLVAGAFNLQTSGDFDCTGFNADKNSKNVIKGKYTCSGSVAKPGGQGTTPSSTASGSKSTKSGSADAVKIPSLPAVMGGTSFLAGLLQLLL